jgi:hypothetical protein
VAACRISECGGIDMSEATYRGRNFMDYRVWEKGETETVIELVGKIPTSDIANQIGRTKSQVLHKLKRMGMSSTKIKHQNGRNMIDLLKGHGYTAKQIKHVLGESVERYL